MIDKTGGTVQQYFQKTEKNLSQPKSVPLSDPAINISDTFNASSKKGIQHLIIPKDAAQAKPEELSKMNVNIESEVPLVGGFVATIDDNTKEKLTKAGYAIFVDKEDNWLPQNPALKNDKESSNIKDNKETKNTEALKERPKLTEPRFDGPLTRQFTGKNVTIAVIDTGIYPHPDFTTPENRIVEFVDFVNGRKVPYDDNGHGTHVAGDAAGSGNTSGGLYKGSAPDAKIIGLKALAGQGGGKLSDVIRAIQWCIDNKEKHNIRVINMSLGHQASDNYQTDPTDIAVQKAHDAGIVVVAAAGNEGPEKGTIAAPGDSPYAITIGAADDYNTAGKSDDKMTRFSSRGPTLSGGMKPDVIAPGEAIVAPMSPGTGAEINSRRYNNLKETMKWFGQMTDEQLMKVPKESLKLIGLSEETLENWYSKPGAAREELTRVFQATQRLPLEMEAYVGMPGTSMASPIAAGVVAQMLEANPNLSPDQVKEILKKTADKLPGNVPEFEQGKGMIDPNEAIQMALDVKEGKLEVKTKSIAEQVEKKARKSSARKKHNIKEV